MMSKNVRTQTCFQSFAEYLFCVFDIQKYLIFQKGLFNFYFSFQHPHYSPARKLAAYLHVCAGFIQFCFCFGRTTYYYLQIFSLDWKKKNNHFSFVFYVVHSTTIIFPVSFTKEICELHCHHAICATLKHHLCFRSVFTVSVSLICQSGPLCCLCTILGLCRECSRELGESVPKVHVTCKGNHNDFKKEVCMCLWGGGQRREEGRVETHS